MSHDRINALMESDLLADVIEADRHGIAVEILHRARLDSDGVAARPIREVAEELRQAEPWWFQQSPKGAASDDSNRAWKGVTAASVAARADHDVEKQRALDVIENGPNPWSTSSFNMTKQALIMNSRPDVATRLQREAGR